MTPLQISVAYVLYAFVQAIYAARLLHKERYRNDEAVGDVFVCAIFAPFVSAWFAGWCIGKALTFLVTYKNDASQ